MGDTCFPECQMHSGKAKKHSGKPSPSATLGEELPGMPFTGKRPSRERGLPRLLKIAHLGKPSPSVTSTLGEELTPFAPSALFSKKKTLPRAQHSGKKFFKKKSSSPSATLGEEFFFKKNSSPSAPSQALGEDYFPLLLENPSPSAPA
jgi:hypothetical protein